MKIKTSQNIIVKIAVIRERIKDLQTINNYRENNNLINFWENKFSINLSLHCWLSFND